MNNQLHGKILTIVEKYIPAAHFNERRKLGQDLSTLCEECLNDGATKGWDDHISYVRSRSIWWRLYYVF